LQLSPETRLRETREFARLLASALPFLAPIAVELNFSCGNIEKGEPTTVAEVKAALRIVSEITGVPVGAKFNITLPVADAVSIALDPNCAFLGAYNTLPDGAILADGRTAREVAGFAEPPLLERVGAVGSYSGKPFLPYSLRWYGQARKAGIAKRAGTPYIRHVVCESAQ
jgi:dihydroorotate dehydrogenase